MLVFLKARSLCSDHLNDVEVFQQHGNEEVYADVLAKNNERVKIYAGEHFTIESVVHGAVFEKLLPIFASGSSKERDESSVEAPEVGVLQICVV